MPAQQQLRRRRKATTRACDVHAARRNASERVALRRGARRRVCRQPQRGGDEANTSHLHQRRPQAVVAQQAARAAAARLEAVQRVLHQKQRPEQRHHRSVRRRAAACVGEESYHRAQQVCAVRLHRVCDNLVAQHRAQRRGEASRAERGPKGDCNVPRKHHCLQRCAAVEVFVTFGWRKKAASRRARAGSAARARLACR